MSLNPRRCAAFLSRLGCLLLALAACAPAVRSSPAARTDRPIVRVSEAQRRKPESARAALVKRLNSIVRDVLKGEPLAGVSVAVLRGQDTLLLRGYGHADLGLKVPASEGTTYRLLGPMLGAAIMQQVERVRLKPDLTCRSALWQWGHWCMSSLITSPGLI